jgi:hypothetical protein
MPIRASKLTFYTKAIARSIPEYQSPPDESNVIVIVGVANHLRTPDNCAFSGEGLPSHVRPDGNRHSLRPTFSFPCKIELSAPEPLPHCLFLIN